MARHKRPKSSSPVKPPKPPEPTEAPKSLLRGKRFLAALSVVGLLAGLAAAAGTYIMRSQPAHVEPPAAVTANYVGSAACQDCHAKEFKAWTGSHHDLALKDPSATTVVGDFNNAKHVYRDVESTFLKRDGKFIVRTDGPDGKLADFVIKYVVGITPLQQYLVEFPGGRLQALSIAWDSRTKENGGQRWFHLYATDKIDHTDALHWTGIYQNWNMQCAACHSTNLRKNYDAGSNTYHTTWSELNVGCEACHGPSSRHVAWARKPNRGATTDDVRALETYLKSGWNEAWRFPTENATFATRDKHAPDATMNVCWPCHARRSVHKEGGPVHAPLLEAYRPSLLVPPLYHADGQQRDEVYTWGSFLQSKMYQRGVTCMDCHEPHALKLRAEGNMLCGRCHNSAVFDSKQHHHHEPGSKGSACTACHMPTQNYMVIDARHDHSFRKPRPDLSAAIGSPDACTQCHTDRKPEWAAAALDKWKGPDWRKSPHHGPVLHAGLTQGLKALPSLLALTQDSSATNIVRATAATIAHRHSGPRTVQTAVVLLKDSDPLVRVAAIGLAERLDARGRARLIAPLLTDPVRSVRIEAGRALADVTASDLAATPIADRDRAVREYEEALQLDADWPTATVNLGNLRRRQGRLEDAKAAYERAVALDPRFSGAYVNLADLHRQLGREGDGEKVLRDGLVVIPQSADLHHALGLLLVRRGDQALGVEALGQAAKLAPDDPHNAYVYAIGLSSTGRAPAALDVLREAQRRHPNEPDILAALVSMERDVGNNPAALAFARKLADVLPGDPGVARLIGELEAANPR